MDYTKQTWITGDVITAEKLNHMEDGISGSEILVLTYDSQTGTYSHTVEECKAAMSTGKPVVYPYYDEIYSEHYLYVAARIEERDGESDIIYFINISNSSFLGNAAFISINSYNGNSMDFISHGTVVPAPYISDVGKVLKVVNDSGSAKLSWETP